MRVQLLLLLLSLLAISGVVMANEIAVEDQSEMMEMVDADLVNHLEAELYGLPESAFKLTKYEEFVKNQMEQQQQDQEALIETENEADIDAENENEAETEGDAEVEGDAETETEGDAESDSESDAESESEAEAESEMSAGVQLTKYEQFVKNEMEEQSMMEEGADAEVEVDPETIGRKVHIHVKTKMHGGDGAQELIRVENRFDQLHDRVMGRLNRVMGRIKNHPDSVEDKTASYAFNN